jgi:hypothetical protein
VASRKPCSAVPSRDGGRNVVFLGSGGGDAPVAINSFPAFFSPFLSFLMAARVALEGHQGGGGS